MPAPRRPNARRIDLLQGTLDLIILQALRWGPRHGYALVQVLSNTSGGVLHVDPGSLYPALHRLERQRLVKASWEKSEHNQRVRVYHITAAGTKQLKQERSRWEEISEAIAGLFARPTTEQG